MATAAWQPTVGDMFWTQSLIRMLKDGGHWLVPAVGEYVIDKEAKKLRLCKRWEVSDEEMHQMIVIAFEKCGYEVVEELDEVQESMN